MKRLQAPKSRAGLVLIAVSTLFVSLIAAFASGGSATAGGPGTWTAFSTGVVGISSTPSVARASDGTLRVLYTSRVGSNTENDLIMATIDASGATATNKTLLPNYSQHEGPVLLINGSTQKAITSGLGQRYAGDIHYSRMFELTSSDNGATWTNQNYTLGKSTTAYGSYGTGAALMPNGTTLAGFVLNSTMTWRNEQLTNPASATDDNTFSASSCCMYNTTIVRSGTTVYAGWYQNGSTEATAGTFVRQLLPTLGPITKVPGSSLGADASDGSTGRVPMVVRPDGSVVVAYCAGYSRCPMGLWQIGAPTYTTVPYSLGDGAISLSSAPDGTLWAGWTDGYNVMASRSGPSDFTFGDPARIAYPANAGTPTDLQIQAPSASLVDLVINDKDQLWHAQATAAMTTPTPTPTPTPTTLTTPTPTPASVQSPTPTRTVAPVPTPTLPPPPPPVTPALRLTIKPSSIDNGRMNVVKARVTSSSSKVSGAKVVGAGTSCTTKGTGICSLKVKPKGAGTLKFKASKSGYISGTDKIKVTSAPAIH